MHFETVLKHLIKLFKDEKVEYALIGGSSLILEGKIPTTFDLDFLLDPERHDVIQNYMISHGFDCLSKNRFVASYKSKKPILGRVNFLIARDEVLKKILNQKRRKKLSREIGFIYFTPIELTALLKTSFYKEVINTMLEAERKAAKYPKITLLQYIRFLDSYQKTFGQFPVSREKIVYKKPIR